MKSKCILMLTLLLVLTLLCSCEQEQPDDTVKVTDTETQTVTSEETTEYISTEQDWSCIPIPGPVRRALTSVHGIML